MRRFGGAPRPVGWWRACGDEAVEVGWVLVSLRNGFSSQSPRRDTGRFYPANDTGNTLREERSAYRILLRTAHTGLVFFLGGTCLCPHSAFRPPGVLAQFPERPPPRGSVGERLLFWPMLPVIIAGVTMAVVGGDEGTYMQWQGLLLAYCCSHCMGGLAQGYTCSKRQRWH